MIYFELTRLATEETCEVGFFFKLSPHCFARLLVFFTNPGGGVFLFISQRIWLFQANCHP